MEGFAMKVTVKRAVGTAVTGAAIAAAGIGGQRACSESDCAKLAAAREVACQTEPLGVTCVRLTSEWQGRCAATPSPITNVTPSPTAPPNPCLPNCIVAYTNAVPPVPICGPCTEPTPHPPTPPPAGCILAGEPEVPISGYVATLGGRVNEAMNALRPDCGIGSRCVITIRPQEWQAQVEAKLREGGLCAGQHTPGTDEIAVATSASKPWEGYHIYSGPGWDDPSATGTVVWYPGAFRGAWQAPTVQPTPPPTATPAACPSPLPPHVYQIVVKPHNAFCANLDSTVKVKGAAYCAEIGFAPNSVCPTRVETDPNRAACDVVALGGAQTWSCVGCEVFPCAVPGNCECAGTINTNPAQATYTGAGTVRSCDAAGTVCGTLNVQ